MQTGTDITVSIFDDRVEIKNLGGLPPGVTEKNLGKISIRRNPLVCEMFNRIDIVEKAGTGFGRMREALAGEGFPEPEILSDFFFFISFKRIFNMELQPPAENKTETAAGAGSLESRGKSSLKSSLKILERISMNPMVTAEIMADELDISTRAVKKHLALLKASGKIRRIGPDKGGHWEVAE